MKPTAGGSSSIGLFWALIDIVIAWVAIAYVTRRIKRSMNRSADE
jgi:ABC-type polysaccharide/polyol phosphate export permease